MLELKKIYLLKYLPAGLAESEAEEITDFYLPAGSAHPSLRLRQRGGSYEITKKEIIDPEDASMREERTISLSAEEFRALAKGGGKQLRKLRYAFPVAGQLAAIDVFQGELLGLVLADFEFQGIAKKDTFEMPEFCLADVTQEEFITGGRLSGKNYADLEADLARFGYHKLLLEIKLTKDSA